MSESSGNNNDEVEEAARNFLEEGRPRREPRRVPFRTLTRIPPPASTSNTLTIPAIERENMLRFLHPFEENQAHNSNFVTFLEFLNGVGWSDDSDSEEEQMIEDVPMLRPPYNYVFDLPADLPDDWECGICLMRVQIDVVLHPERCHSFHRECLARWLDENPSCPICRRCLTPLLMVPAAS
jgi:hypothetical protein